MPSSRLVILPYKMGSQSAKRLAISLTQALQLKVRRVRHDGTYRPKLRSLVLNYGSSGTPRWLAGHTRQVVNDPAAVAVASNKLSAFRRFAEANVSTPEWTTDRAVAQQWVSEGSIAVCRTLLNAHSGRGIVLAQNVDGLVFAPLYVKYKKKKKEFRVHVFKGEVIDVCEKRRIRDAERRPEGEAAFIRNHHNGWVFCRDAVVEPPDLRTCALDAIRALTLDFGAVDIIWNERDNRCYALEVNTAPGLEGTTLIKYVNAIVNWVKR